MVDTCQAATLFSQVCERFQIGLCFTYVIFNSLIFFFKFSGCNQVFHIVGG